MALNTFKNVTIWHHCTLIACSHRRHGQEKNSFDLFVSAVWTQLQTRQDSFVSSSRPSVDEFCLVSTQFPICNCSASNRLRITENLEIENWVETRQNSSKLGPDDETKLSCLVCSCVHTADTDKTRHSGLVRIGGVNKLWGLRVNTMPHEINSVHSVYLLMFTASSNRRCPQVLYTCTHTHTK